jgi:hypothetical protein
VAEEEVENSTVPKSISDYDESVRSLSDSLDEARVATEENVGA